VNRSFEPHHTRNLTLQVGSRNLAFKDASHRVDRQGSQYTWSNNISDWVNGQTVEARIVTGIHDHPLTLLHDHHTRVNRRLWSVTMTAGAHTGMGGTHTDIPPHQERRGRHAHLRGPHPGPGQLQAQKRHPLLLGWRRRNPGYDVQHATMGLTPSRPPPSDFLLPVRSDPPSDTAVSASAQRFAPWRAVARSALRLFATLRVLEDVADSIWNLRADIRGWRLLRDGLDRQIQQHNKRSRTARSQQPGAEDIREWWPIC